MVATGYAVSTDAEIVERALYDMARFYQSSEKARTLIIFDRDSGNFLLLDEGWDGFKRIHSTWLHVEIRDGKLWIHKDGTQEGVTERLVAAGIPGERIVLAFQHPSMRKYTDFAAE